jgi:aminoglycoside phosphotransferase (APT) family kinase protein
MRRPIDWLPKHIPPGDEATVVHGDFRLDNLMIFHLNQPRESAFSTGSYRRWRNPLDDFAYHCMSDASLPRCGVASAVWTCRCWGVPVEAYYVEPFTQSTSRQPQQHWEFYKAYILLGMAAILRGIGQRAADGTAASADAMENARRAGPLAEIGRQCALKYRTP